jgi:undecaprenyl-diphosphatase
MSLSSGEVVSWLRRSVLRHVETRTLFLTLIVLLAGWAFVALAGEVTEGETSAFDRAVILSLRNPADLADPIGPPWVEELGRDITALGGVGVLTIVTVAVSVFLWLQGNRRTVALLLVSIGGGRIVSSLLKLAFDRPRPDLVPYGSIVHSTSFPSTHSMMATIAYLTLAILLARVQTSRAVKLYLISLAAFLAVIVGVSRVYLGVHWPTDVIAGWTVGILWAMGTFAVAEALERRGAVEPERDERRATADGR